MNTGENIAGLRMRAGMTQDELAERLFVSRQLVSLWESGRRRPGREYIGRLAAVFGVPEESIAPVDSVLIRELASCLPDGADIRAETFSPKLNDFVSGLNDRERNYFIRRYYYSEDYSVIAAGFGVKENAVRATVARTRKKLKKYLKG